MYPVSFCKLAGFRKQMKTCKTNSSITIWDSYLIILRKRLRMSIMYNLQPIMIWKSFHHRVVWTRDLLTHLVNFHWIQTSLILMPHHWKQIKKHFWIINLNKWHPLSSGRYLSFLKSKIKKILLLLPHQPHHYRKKGRTSWSKIVLLSS